jgi:hypothetical protein
MYEEQLPTLVKLQCTYASKPHLHQTHTLFVVDLFTNTTVRTPITISVKDKNDPVQVKQYYDSAGLKRLLLAELARDVYGFFKPPLLKRKMLPWGRYIVQLIEVTVFF